MTTNNTPEMTLAEAVEILGQFRMCKGITPKGNVRRTWGVPCQKRQTAKKCEPCQRRDVAQQIVWDSEASTTPEGN